MAETEETKRRTGHNFMFTSFWFWTDIQNKHILDFYLIWDATTDQIVKAMV